MATHSLALWAVDLQHANLTAGVISAAVATLYNWAGCAIGGYAQSAPRVALNATLPFYLGAANTSSILGAANTSLHTDAQTAALVNGIASHVDDYDDTHLDTIIHPAGPVASALLAVAEWKAPVSGKDFLTAFVAGVEAELHLGLAVYPEHYDVGWHITSTAGSIGAAVAVGKLLGLQVEEMEFAIGIAATQVVGMQEHFGSDTKSFHIGRAAQGGMLAAVLAEGGFTSSTQGLEAKFGWANVVSTKENLTDEFATLGKVWEIEKNTYKPFPCGIVIHPTIDGSIQLRDQALSQGLRIGDIKSVEARVNPEVLILTGKMDPKTGLEGKFSVYHATAVAFLYGRATPAEFTNQVARNATVADFRKKINITTDDSVTTAEAFVSVTFQDGTTLEKHIEHAIGSIEKPLSPDQLRTKFLGQASLVIGQDRAMEALKMFMEIGNMTDVGRLSTAFSGANLASRNSGSMGSGIGANLQHVFAVLGSIFVVLQFL